MKIKRGVVFCILALSFFKLSGQSSIRLNNFLCNTQHINPATVYDKYAAVFTLTGRLQWVGFTGAPKTFFATGTTYLDKFNTQLTLRLIQDKIGYTSSTSIGGAYAYAVNIDRESQLHLGVGANYRYFSYDLSKMDLENKVDPEAYDRLKSEGTYNAELGIEYFTRNLKIGASSQNILSRFRAGNQLDNNTNFLYAKYRQTSTTGLDFGGGLCSIEYEKIVQMEFAISTYFRQQHSQGLHDDNQDVFDMSLYYRTKSEVGLIFGYNISKTMHVAYSYDYNFGDIRQSSFGTNEIILTFNINRRPECKTCWH